MFIEPNTTIRILKGVPLDPTYEHTIYFDTELQQRAYFAGMMKYGLYKQNYQRVQRGSMRVEIPAENLYDCNYLAFQNTAFGDKWFYAFISGVEYINNATSQIDFQIDIMQTWHFDYRLGECFVEREHNIFDSIGGNLVPENLELGEYVSDDFDGTQVLGPKAIVVASTFDANYDNISGSYYCGLFSGLYFHVFDNTTEGAQACSDFISGAGSKASGIVSVFLMSKAMVGQMLDSAKTHEVNKTKSISKIGNYTPRNKKLLTYPYNFLYVTNLQGNYAEYPYEYFSEGECTFMVAGDMSCNPSVVLVPMNYKGVPTNYDEKMVLSGYPQLAFNTDSFKAWLAQNGSSLGVSTLGSAMTAGLGLAFATTPAGLAMAGASLATGVASSVAQVYQHSVMPRQSHGSSGSQTMAAIGVLDFVFMHKHIREEFARIIDDYFDMFGYATHKVKTPNRKVRPHWTFTKTKGCTLIGSIPADDARAICSIYDNGITFWVKGENVGNYSLDNSPTYGGE